MDEQTFNSELPLPNEDATSKGAFTMGYWHGKLAIPGKNGLVLIRHDQILLMSAEGAYTRIHVVDGKQVLACSHLGRLHQALPQPFFCRCHNRHVVNLEHVQEVLWTNGFRMRLANGEHVEVSRRRWREVRDAVTRMGRMP